MLVTIHSSRPIGGSITAPPSKSMAHRAVLCAALATGSSHITNLEFSKDISATLAAAGQLCARVTTGPADAVVEGLGRFAPLTAPVDCCESGSTLRFLIPIASLTGQEVTFTGRGRLMERPQSVYETLYREQDLRFEQTSAGLTVAGALTPGEYRLAGNVSSQFISGLLFALPLLDGDSTLHLIPPVESRSYIDMTRAVQAAFGVTSRWLDGNTLALPGRQHYHPCDHAVEGDYSQAAFPAVLGAVCGGVTVTGLSPDTLQGDAVILDLLHRCGAQFTREEDTVTFAKAPLHGVDIDLADCPDLGPVLMVLGLLCEGTTVIRNAERLRLKPNSFSVAGPEKAYIFHAFSVSPSIIDVAIDSPTPGVVNVYTLLTGGALPSMAFLQEVEDYLSGEEIRPLTDEVHARAPTASSYSVNVDYYVLQSDAVRLSAIQTAVQAAVNDYVAWQQAKIGRDINPDELIKRVRDAGAGRILHSTLTPAFKTLTKAQVAQCSSVTVTFKGLEDG